MREITDNGRDFLIRQEGLRLSAYDDTDPDKAPDTIGVGHLLTRSELSSGKIMLGHDAVKWSQGITKEQAMHLLHIDLYDTELTIQTDARNAKLNDNQFDALVSFVFNIGSQAYRGSTLRRRLVEGDMNAVPVQMLRWDKDGGKVVPGLARRRREEAALWKSA